jgi:hypothetical protein
MENDANLFLDVLSVKCETTDENQSRKSSSTFASFK